MSKVNYLISFIVSILLIGCFGARYTEGDVMVDGVLRHYYFSNTPEGIERAILDNLKNTTFSLSVKNAPWEVNPNLAQSVKLATEKKRATYSTTFILEDKETYLVINRKHNKTWYITWFILE